MSKVSVIVPNYNHAQYLQKRIDSILDQTYIDFELIILDDASSDHSREVINQYQHHPKVKHVVFNTVNSGSTFVQWKKGLDIASGSYVWIAESDDFAKPTFLEKLVEILDQYSYVTVAFCSSNWVDANDEIILYPTQSEQLLHEGKELVRKEFVKGNVIPNASMAVFRKSATSNVNFEDLSKFKYCGDWLFWVLLIYPAKAFQYNEALNFYRRHNQSVSSTVEKQGLFFIEGLSVLTQIKNRVALSKKELVHLSKTWGYKLFEFSRSNSRIKGSIFKAFCKHLPLALLFFILYLVKYYNRPVQN